MFLIDLAEEIALVLVAVHPGEQLMVAIGCRGPTAIVPGRDGVGAQLGGRFPEEIKLDFPVAQDIRVGGSTGGILGKHVVHNPLLVGVGEVDYLEGNAQMLGDEQGIVGIVHPGAGVVQCDRIVNPVAHEDANDLVALLLEKPGGDTAVHTTGKSDHYAHSAKLTPVGIREFHSRPILSPHGVQFAHFVKEPPFRGNQR